MTSTQTPASATTPAATAATTPAPAGAAATGAGAAAAAAPASGSTTPTGAGANFHSASLYVGDLGQDITEALLFEVFNNVGASVFAVLLNCELTCARELALRAQAPLRRCACAATPRRAARWATRTSTSTARRTLTAP